MPEAKFELKGPLGAILGVIVIGAVVYFKFFMPFSATVEDKKAIKEKIQEIQMADIARIAKTTVEQYKNKGKTRDTSQEIKDLSGKVEITKIEGKKPFFGSIKVKVNYTLDGKTPKTDGGVLYFRLYRRKRRKNSMRKITEVSQITEDDFKK